MIYPFKFSQLWIRREIEHELLTQNVRRNILNFIPEIKIVPLADARDEENARQRFLQESVDPYGDAKQILLLTPFLGQAYKVCPGTDGVLCCNLRIVNFASGCPMDCSYCYLQGYLTNPILSVYANVESIFQQIEKMVITQPQRKFRIGTGEITDSLVFDPLTEFSRMAVRRFRQWPNVTLELKTKTHFVEGLLKEQGHPEVVIAFSVNPQRIIEAEEHRTSSLEKRLESAQHVAAAGYSIAFHFDPVIVFPGWPEAYGEVVKEIASRIPAGSIRWISVGGLRFTRVLRDMMRLRFPSSPLTYGESVPSTDAKFRYHKELRIHVFATFKDILKRFHLENKMYLCMENTSVWKRSLDRLPLLSNELFGRPVLDPHETPFAKF